MASAAGGLGARGIETLEAGPEIPVHYESPTAQERGLAPLGRAGQFALGVPPGHPPPGQPRGQHVGLEHVLVRVKAPLGIVLVDRDAGLALVADHEPKDGPPLVLRHGRQIGIEGQLVLAPHDPLPEVGEKPGTGLPHTSDAQPLLDGLDHVPLFVYPGDLFAIGVDDGARVPGVMGVAGAVGRVAERPGRFHAAFHHGQLGAGKPAHGIAVASQVGVVMGGMGAGQLGVEYPDAQGLGGGQDGGLGPEEVELAGPHVHARRAHDPGALPAPFGEQPGDHDMLAQPDPLALQSPV